MGSESVHLLRRTLKALCYSGKLVKAIGVLCRTDLQLDCDAYALILQECISRKDYKNGKRVHAHMVEIGVIPNEFLKIKLFILSSLSGDIDSACIAFNKMPKKSLICWNAIISGCIQKGLHQNGLGFYNRLRLQEEDDTRPDHFTFAPVLKACACLAALEQGRHVHGVMLKSQPFENVVSNTSLIDMYFKCSSEVDAQKVFDQCSHKNVVTWTTLISGYSRIGMVSRALEFFNLMKMKGFTPNNITFISVLCACDRGGCVDEGLGLFSSMITCHGVLQTPQHHAVMVNLLGRAGHLELARKFAQSSPFSEHPVIWGALMGASLLHCNLVEMKLASWKLSELGYNEPDKYVFMSNAYASFGFWNDVSDVRGLMKESRLKKEPSYSRIEINNEVLYFFMGDKLDNEGDLLYQVIYQLNEQLKTF